VGSQQSWLQPPFEAAQRSTTETDLIAVSHCGKPQTVFDWPYFRGGNKSSRRAI